MAKIGHIALVGCGFTGTSAFFQLVERYPVSTISIFQADGDFGPGYPYHTDECSDYLMNNTTDTMGLTIDHRTAFLEWLQERPEFGAVKPKGHVPRAWFGLFLKRRRSAVAWRRGNL